jgi:hypothetical protein
MGRRNHESFVEANSTISSLGNSSVGMLRWKEKILEYQRRRRQRDSDNPNRPKSSHRRTKRVSSSHDSKFKINLTRLGYAIISLLCALAFLQRQVVFDVIQEFLMEEVNNLPTQRRQSKEVYIPISDYEPLSTFSTLKKYEMSRAANLASDELRPQVSSNSHTFIENNLVSIASMAFSSERRRLISMTPFFWHIPKSGGTTVHQFVASCLRLRVASNVGILFGHDEDETLQLVETPSNLTYVNIDATSREGLQRAKKIGFVGSGIADIIISPLFIDVVERLFSPKYKGAVFTIMRHPVERSISMFHYLKEAYWEPTYRPEFKNWTLMDYVRRPDMDADWMVRFLVNKPGNPEDVPLTRQDLERAKIIVRDKIWVGFLDDMEGSIEAFGRKFGWSKISHFTQCVHDLSHGGANKNHHDAVSPKSQEWKELEDVHALDIELYNYAREFWKR